METDLEEILEKIYETIHKFLEDQLGEDLSYDLIDIKVETESEGQLTVDIDLNLEIFPFSRHDVQEIADNAIKKGIDVADSICPDIIIKLRKTKHADQ